MIMTADGWGGFSRLLALVAMAPLAACGQSQAPQIEQAGAVAWQPPVTVATGPAERGPWRMNQSRFHYVDDPSVALASDGDVLVAWVDNQAQTVYFQRYDNELNPRLDSPVAVSDSPKIFSWLPRIASVNDGQTVLVAWQEILFTGGSHGGEILLARSTDGGRSFETPINLSNTTGGASKGRLSPERWDNGSLDLVAAGNRVHVAWTEYDGKLRVASSADGGQHFADPVDVAGSGGRPTRGPALALLEDGRLLLAWTFGEDNSADVQLAVSSDHGQRFEQLGAAHRRFGHADAPRLAVDGRGQVHLVWAESAGSREGPARLVYARSRANELSFDDARTIVDIDGDQRLHAGFPQVVEAADRLIVSWEVLARRQRASLGLGWVYSDDSGAQFSRPQLVPGTQPPQGAASGGLQGLLTRKLAADREGKLVLVHSHFDPGSSSQVVLVRGQISGHQNSEGGRSDLPR